MRAYAVGQSETAALPRNVPRLIHEGNWSAMIGSPINAFTSIVLLGLIVTGTLMWARRWLRRRQVSLAHPTPNGCIEPLEHDPEKCVAVFRKDHA